VTSFATFSGAAFDAAMGNINVCDKIVTEIQKKRNYGNNQKKILHYSFNYKMI